VTVADAPVEAGQGIAPPVHRRRGGAGARSTALGVAGLVGFGLLLEIVPRVGLVDRAALPPTSEILSALVTELGEPGLWQALRSTMTAWAIGLTIASIAAVLVGLLLGSIPFLRASTASTIEFLRPIPSVALIPLAVLLYGNAIESTLLLVVYACFWQVLVQVIAGVADVDPVAADTARSYGLGPLARVRYVTWPTALPYVMTGLRLAASVALVLAITVELITGAPGLGSEISAARSGGAVPLTYALVVVSGLVGVTINLVARAVERRALSWHPSVRGEAVS
jgi:ABC-type nitrate/sulfonate/bicarbonate transport system permease component